MRTFTAADAKNRFGELLDAARREPVSIERHGRPVAVMISQEEYASYEQVYAELLSTRIADAEAAVKQGDIVSADALFTTLRSQLNRGAA
ncbi:MAG: type II toxin-antitoxin system Phd/YefM family antitoxin [Oceanicaulis sp.]|nr:type II toxin-antitoxin system Phd/YefM family antitoxin [Oceanicaulis sp.]